MTPNLPCPCSKCIQKGREQERPKGLRSVATGTYSMGTWALYRDNFQVRSLLGLEGVTPEGPFSPGAGGAHVRAHRSRLYGRQLSPTEYWMGESTGIYSSRRSRCRLPATSQGEGTARGSPDWPVSEELFPFRRGKGGRHSRVRTRSEAQAMAGTSRISSSGRKIYLFIPA